MYHIPFADGIIMVDCRWRSYDPDRFEIYSMEWKVDHTEVGLTIPKSVWWNLKLSRDQLVFNPYSVNRNWWVYIHEYIFEWLCNYEPITIEYYEDYP